MYSYTAQQQGTVLKLTPSISQLKITMAHQHGAMHVPNSRNWANKMFLNLLKTVFHKRGSHPNEE